MRKEITYLLFGWVVLSKAKEQLNQTCRQLIKSDTAATRPCSSCKEDIVGINFVDNHNNNNNTYSQWIQDGSNNVLSDTNTQHHDVTSIFLPWPMCALSTKSCVIVTGNESVFCTIDYVPVPSSSSSSPFTSQPSLFFFSGDTSYSWLLSFWTFFGKIITINGFF